MPSVAATDKCQFGVERFATAWAEAEALAAANFAEIDAAHALRVQVGLFEFLESNGCLRVYTARVDGTLVGYRVLAVAKHPHTSRLVAQNSALYLDPEHRAANARAFVLWTERQLAADGVTEVFQTHKPQVRDLGRFLVALGYSPLEVTYSKRL